MLQRNVLCCGGQGGSGLLGLNALRYLDFRRNSAVFLHHNLELYVRGDRHVVAQRNPVVVRPYFATNRLAAFTK